MADPCLQYWEDALGEALSEIDAYSVLTGDQQKAVAKSLMFAHECFGMSFYTPPSPEPSEIKRLEAELRKERSKVGCPTCGGRGRLSYNAGPWGVNTGCHTCRGEGKVLP
jgi:hypothetical protein